MSAGDAASITARTRTITATCSQTSALQAAESAGKQVPAVTGRVVGVEEVEGQTQTHGEVGRQAHQKGDVGGHAHAVHMPPAREREHEQRQPALPGRPSTR